MLQISSSTPSSCTHSRRSAKSKNRAERGSSRCSLWDDRTDSPWHGLPPPPMIPVTPGTCFTRLLIIFLVNFLMSLMQWQPGHLRLWSRRQSASISITTKLDTSTFANSNDLESPPIPAKKSNTTITSFWSMWAGTLVISVRPSSKATTSVSPFRLDKESSFNGRGRTLRCLSCPPSLWGSIIRRTYLPDDVPELRTCNRRWAPHCTVVRPSIGFSFSHSLKLHIAVWSGPSLTSASSPLSPEEAV